MIQNSFIFLDHIGSTLEKNLWKQGILDWDSFIATERIKSISSMRKSHYDRKIREARTALYNGHSSYFSRVLSPGETYRLYDFFREDAVFLDIETSGLSPYYSDVTMVGLYDGLNTKTMIKGINLDYKSLQQELQKYKIILTFNGGSFDLPFLNKQFPGIIPFIPHIDLKGVCRKLELRGGLKNIERTLNIRRRELVGDMNGGDALALWRMYRGSGDEHYLNLLIEYNEEDVINLKTIADYAIKEIQKRTIGCHRFAPLLSDNHAATSP